MKTWLTFIAFFITGQGFAQKQFLLKQNYPVNKSYDFTLVSDQIIKQSIGTTNVNITQNIGTDYVFDIKEASHGDKSIKVTYKRLTMHSVAMGNTMDFDSDQADADDKNPFTGLKGAGYTMVIDHNGSVKSVSGVEEMLDQAVKKMATDSTQVTQIKKELSKQLSAGSIRESMEASFKIYPEKAIKIGDSWEINTKMQIMMPTETHTVYTLKEIKGELAVLKVKGTLLSKGDFEINGNKVTTDLQGTNSGETEIDLKTGIILTSHLRMELLGTMQTQGQLINFEMQGINRITGKAIN